MRVHMMGIGGSGVSALARALIARGEEVSGCDQRHSETTLALTREGARVALGHHASHVEGQDLIVYSGAVTGAAPELEAARAAGIEVLSRAELLARLIAETDSVAIAGTHGKTTLTYMLGHILTVAGWDPTVLVGDGSSSRAGRGPWLVAEADESDGSLVLHHPRRAILTNLELDHPDHFKDVDEVASLFQGFLHNLPTGGLAVVCADDPRCLQLAVGCPRVTYGFGEADYRCGDARPFPINHAGVELGRIDLPQAGRHNVQNACGAAAMALELGVPFPVVAAALASFPGAHRRLEPVGTWRGARLFDDYGHHPTEVVATLQAARELAPSRLVVVFQPHRFSRLVALRDDFARSFGDADAVVITEVYAAGEENPNAVSSRELASLTPGAVHAPDPVAVVDHLRRLAGEGDLILFMGAGDIGRLARELADSE